MRLQEIFRGNVAITLLLSSLASVALLQTGNAAFAQRSRQADVETIIIPTTRRNLERAMIGLVASAYYDSGKLSGLMLGRQSDSNEPSQPPLPGIRLRAEENVTAMSARIVFGDIIVSVDGIDVTSASRLNEALLKIANRSVTELRLDRNGKRIIVRYRILSD